MVKKVQAIASDISNRDKPHDIFYTPTELAKAHLRECVPYYKEGDLVYDPFFGHGAYYNLYDEFFPNCQKEFTEIEMGKDFFAYDGKPDMIVSNPPFSLMTKVMIRLTQLRPKCISIVMGCLNVSPRRLRMMDDAGYTLVSQRIENVFEWFGRLVLMTWIRKDHLTSQTAMCKVSWGERSHRNNMDVPSKERKKKITSDSLTPASE
jgi:hypothetical protein